MFNVEGRKQKVEFSEYIKSLRIVPVSISYENDPCDIAKARELYEKATHGKYEKGEFEDIESIIQGIIGDKGRVHEDADITPAVKAKLEQKLSQIPLNAHQYLLDSYANPVRNQ